MHSEKFEIINGKWIRSSINNWSNALKIDSINNLSRGRSIGLFYIILNLDGGEDGVIKFMYNPDEEALYRQDLAFLEDLLFNR